LTDNRQRKDEVLYHYPLLNINHASSYNHDLVHVIDQKGQVYCSKRQKRADNDSDQKLLSKDKYSGLILRTGKVEKEIFFKER